MRYVGWLLYSYRVTDFIYFILRNLILGMTLNCLVAYLQKNSVGWIRKGIGLINLNKVPS